MAQPRQPVRLPVQLERLVRRLEPLCPLKKKSRARVKALLAALSHLSSEKVRSESGSEMGKAMAMFPLLTQVECMLDYIQGATDATQGGERGKKGQGEKGTSRISRLL